MKTWCSWTHERWAIYNDVANKWFRSRWTLRKWVLIAHWSFLFYAFYFYIVFLPCLAIFFAAVFEIAMNIIDFSPQLLCKFKCKKFNGEQPAPIALLTVHKSLNSKNTCPMMYMQCFEFFYKLNQMLELVDWAEVPESRCRKWHFWKRKIKLHYCVRIKFTY